MDKTARFAPYALAAVLLTACALPLVQASPEEERVTALALEPFDSIYIMGNEDFTAENGVISGTGSSGDPYIIEGWELVFNNSGTGITVTETDRYFVIRNVHIIGAKIGVRFEEVYHARVTETTIENCSTGLSAVYSEVSKVDYNVISNCSVGVSMRYCDAFKVTDNTFIDNEQDIKVVSLPWVETRQADLLFGVIAACLVVFVILLLYARFKYSRPPEEKP